MIRLDTLSVQSLIHHLLVEMNALRKQRLPNSFSTHLQQI